MSNHQGNNQQNAGMQIWYCHNCNQVHLRTTNVMLDFTKKEFLGLGDAIFGILRNDFTPEDLQGLQNFDAELDDILFAETIV